MAAFDNHCPKMGSCGAVLLSAPPGVESFFCWSLPDQGTIHWSTKGGRKSLHRPVMLKPRRCGILCTSLPMPAKCECELANRTELRLSVQLLKAEPGWRLLSAWMQKDGGSICHESCSGTLGEPKESHQHWRSSKLLVHQWSPQESCPSQLLLTIYSWAPLLCCAQPYKRANM